MNGVLVLLLIAVSLPVVVDPLITSQVGSFALDLAWISAGFLIWMPVQPARCGQAKACSRRGLRGLKAALNAAMPW